MMTASAAKWTSTMNKRIVVVARPERGDLRSCFEVRAAPIPRLAAGEVLVRTCWLAFDPAQRGYLNDIPSYIDPVAIGDVMRATGLGEVVASRHPSFETGTMVVGSLGWQEYCSASADDPKVGLERVPPGIEDPRAMLHVLGTTGLTAYIGMAEVGRVRQADVVLVTAAAGATGSVAGQIARLLGASRVVGTAGTPEKRRWVVDVAGFDACVDYRDPKLRHALRAEAPRGFDVVFDNVGGTLLDLALGNLALGARVALCGAISTGYRAERPADGLRNYQLLTARRARMEGFIVLDHEARFEQVRAKLATWLAGDCLRFRYDVAEGLEEAPATLEGLFAGGNSGKQLLRVSEPGPQGINA